MKIFPVLGIVFGLLALLTAIIALSLGRWENETGADYFRSSVKYDQLRFSRVTSMISLTFNCLGILGSLWMTWNSFRQYWNLLPASAYLLAALAVLITISDASRTIHHDTWSAYIYAMSFALLLIACQVMAALAGEQIFS